jgi:hypothetical protein
MVTDEQVRLLRRQMTEGKTMATAAAVAGMSERSARKWQTGALPSAAKQPRQWRTRQDPFEAVWQSELVPQLERDEEGVLEAVTLLGALQERHPGKFNDGQLRTLQRRVRDWKAQHGPAKEVFFEQVAEPGREAAVDFTNCNELGVTIAGRAFPHLLFHFVLSFSGWTWVTLAFSETFEALVRGLQQALWALGGAPAVCRSDNLSAATHELKQTGGRSLTARFKAVLDHYGMLSTRINPGESHENGRVEKTHDLVKSAVAQELVLRGSRDFESPEAYLAFVRGVVAKRRNRGTEAALAEEQAHLRPLPSAPVPEYTVFHPRVRRWSTVRVGGKTYSVPSRLIGHEVEVRQHPDIVEVRFRNKTIETMPRIRGESGHRIDYRHIIWSLVRKPGAFARYRYREDLFPTLAFRRAYDALQSFGSRADVEYVRILHLAASTSEATVAAALEALLSKGERFDYLALRALAQPEKPAVPDLAVLQPNLAVYDTLLAGGAR